MVLTVGHAEGLPLAPQMVVIDVRRLVLCVAAIAVLVTIL